MNMRINLNNAIMGLIEQALIVGVMDEYISFVSLVLFCQFCWSIGMW